MHYGKHYNTLQLAIVSLSLTNDESRYSHLKCFPIAIGTILSENKRGNLLETLALAPQLSACVVHPFDKATNQIYEVVYVMVLRCYRIREVKVCNQHETLNVEGRSRLLVLRRVLSSIRSRTVNSDGIACACSFLALRLHYTHYSQSSELMENK